MWTVRLCARITHMTFRGLSGYWSAWTAPEQCAAFRDDGNDIEMLQYCGYSYAMANAPENVKKAAKYVCPSNEEDGVLDVLECLSHSGADFFIDLPFSQTDNKISPNLNPL